MPIMLALFERTDDAARAINTLRERGFHDQDMSVFARDRTLRQEATGGEIEAGGSVAGASAGTGAAIGGIGGLSIGLLSLALPGIGTAIGGGILVAAGWTAAGAAVGAGVGGLLGRLMEAGVAEEDAHVYAEGVKRGGILVALQTSDDRLKDASLALSDSGAIDIEIRRQQWRQQGWQRFDETTMPDDTYPSL